MNERRGFAELVAGALHSNGATHNDHELQHSARCRPRTIQRQITLIFLPVLYCHYNFKAAECGRHRFNARDTGMLSFPDFSFFLSLSSPFFFAPLFFPRHSSSDTPPFRGHAIKHRLQSDFSWRSTLFFHKIFPIRGFSKGDAVGKRISRMHRPI